MMNLIRRFEGQIKGRGYIKEHKVLPKGKSQKHTAGTRHQWLTPVILATQETETRRIKVGSQPQQIVLETLSLKNPSQKKDGGVAQGGVGPEFKPQYCKKERKYGRQ
jgi:hypothetical protein